MYIIIWILVSSAAVVPGCASESCSTLEKTAAGSSPPSDSQLTSGTFALTSAPLSCAGTATQWRVCYYKSTSNTIHTTTFGVFRRSTTSSMMLNSVAGNNVGYITVEGTSSYSCSNITVTTPFKVMPGDVIVVCVLSEMSSAIRLGAAVVLPRASVLHQQDICTTLPSSIDLTRFVQRSDLTVLVSLDIIGCGTNSYFLDSNTTNCSYTSMLSPVNQDTSTTLKHESQNQITGIVVGVIVSILSVIGIIVPTIFVRQRCVRKRNEQPQTGFGIHKKEYVDCDLEMRDLQPNPSYASVKDEGPNETSDHSSNNTQTAARDNDENLYYAPASQEVELYIQLENQKILKVKRHEIETTDVMLGSGHFGGVQVAVWNGPKGKCEVAIKTLNPSSIKPEDKIKFLQEAAIMAQFKHPNVIQLYGIVTDGEQVLLVMELAGNRDLLTHLATMRPNSFDSSIKSDLPKVLLIYSKQIALGMQYLSSKSFVHRDLAARNVLITKDCICKIADFGMSRDLAEGQYYMSHGGLVPVKWTAPEALCFMKYSTASDVWSYGCLLYEIWSIGGTPFKGLTNEEALQKVNTGYRLPPPLGCPLLLYQIMIKCWNPDAHLRPNFKDIYTCLSLHEDVVLAIPNEALLTHSQSGYLGAPLEAGNYMYLDLDMYLDLQNSYI